jgi:hypothetical protein
MSGLRRDKLQKASSGRSLLHSSMNDFPIPEDPPVMMTAEMSLSAASGDAIGQGRLILRRPAFHRLHG